MSIRLRVILIISFCNLLIVMFSVFIGGRFVSERIKAAQEADMLVVANIADRYLSNEIELLYLKANTIAQYLASAETSSMRSRLVNMIKQHPDFIGAAVFEASGRRIVAYGELPPPADAMTSTHIARALVGAKNLNTTYPVEVLSDPAGNTTQDNVVFYLSVPIERNDDIYVLAITIPGTFFHYKLLEFEIWQTGHIFCLAPDGTFVSNPRKHWVTQRWNVHQMLEDDKGFESFFRTALKMRTGEDGIGYYTIYGVERVCAYRPITGSNDGWSLGTVAPLPESPFRFINMGLLIAGSMGFILGIIGSIIAAHFIKKPFDRIEALQIESEKNSRYKSQFLANMSHEMRTPLTSVIGLTELTLRKAKLDNETYDNLVKVYRSGETLLGLINDILDISKIEAGKLNLNLSNYDLPSMLNDTITQSLLYIGEKDIELVLDIPEDLPRRLQGDELRIKQIYNNLLSNAFKFTIVGKVEFKISCEISNDDVILIVRVSDTGIGIRPQDYDKLFTLYGKMDQGSQTYDITRRTEGTGLGLSISKRLVELMDGSIEVESEYGKGSTFSVRIKQKCIDATPIGAGVVNSLKKFHYSIDKFSNDNTSRLNLSYATVLVVDDNVANLDVAKGLMSLYGMTIDCVTSGQAAIDAVREEKVTYNAIFMDQMMPEIDGIEATKKIREIGTKYATTVPIIALTANAILGSEEYFLKNGFCAYVAKPIDLTKLDNVLRKWVRNKDAEALLKSKKISPMHNITAERTLYDKEIPDIDIRKGIAHFGDNEKIFYDVLQSYALNTKPLLEQLKLVTKDTLANYALIVHGIKGSSRGIYAHKVGEVAEALEMAAKDNDFQFVQNQNATFIAQVSKLIADIEATLTECEIQKPIKDTPDSELLLKLLGACENYDIDEIDFIMNKIDSFDYHSKGELVTWLKDNIMQGNIKQVQAKLRELSVKEG